MAMKKYIVRKNCEYAIEIEAETPDKAIEEADEIHTDDWSAAWSATECDEDEEAKE